MAERDWVITGSLLIGLPLFLYIIISTKTGTMLSLLTTSPIQPIIGLVITAIAVILLFNTTWRILLQATGNTIPFHHMLRYRLVGLALSYVTPGPRIGGEITQARIASRETDIPETTLITTSATEKICQLLAGLLFDTVTIGIAITIIPVPTTIRYVFYTLLALVILIPLLYQTAVTNQTNIVSIITNSLERIGLSASKTYQDAFIGAEETFKSYLRSHKKAISTGLLVILVTKFLVALQIVFIGQMLSLSITYIQAMLLTAAIDIAYSIPAYMGIGVLEAGQASVFAILSLPTGAGVTVALLIRSRDLFFSSIGLGFLWQHRQSYPNEPSQTSGG